MKYASKALSRIHDDEDDACKDVDNAVVDDYLVSNGRDDAGNEAATAFSDVGDDADNAGNAIYDADFVGDAGYDVDGAGDDADDVDERVCV